MPLGTKSRDCPSHHKTPESEKSLARSSQNFVSYLREIGKDKMLASYKSFSSYLHNWLSFICNLLISFLLKITKYIPLQKNRQKITKIKALPFKESFQKESRNDFLSFYNSEKRTKLKEARSFNNQILVNHKHAFKNMFSLSCYQSIGYAELF